MKKTLILGASDNPERYAFRAARMLQQYGHDFVPVGIKKATILGKEIQSEFPSDGSIDTVTLYISPKRQEEYYPRLLKLKPKRVIFNPGTENPELEALLKIQGIEPVEACTLVLLSTGQY